MLGDTFLYSVLPLTGQSGHFWEFFMKPLSRHSVSKGRSASQFKSNSARTKGLNMRAAPMRGGIRL
ncbi:MAG: hypothetical protein [Microvirus sp.]|nr:MAG: hypothetical protein [Microvirus sp.]